MTNRNEPPTMDANMPTRSMSHKRWRALAAVGLLAGSSACDLSVTNPGPVQDVFLNSPGAQQSVVAGADVAMAYALNWIAFTGSHIARETVPAGNAGNLFGAPELVRQGILDPDENNEHWENAHKARWVAEDAVRRFAGEGVLDDFDSNANVARALLIAGYANRLLGENMCKAVIDGGAEEPHTVHLTRADSLFTQAHEIAGRAGNTQIQTAAIAGRAAVRVHLGDWAGAVADARMVPADFVYQQHFYTQEWDDYNRFYWGNANLPFRSHTVWGTFYETYYQETSDPRTPWGTNPDIPFGTTSGIPWYSELKYDEIDSPINLSTGREMQLILAEAALREGRWQEALGTINQLRADVGVAGWTATSAVEAWEALKRERGIELWLEGRRLGDLRRWAAEGTPGETTDMTGRSLCFPISHTESETNQNLGG